MELIELKTVQEVKIRWPYGLGILIVVQLLFFFTIQLGNYQARQEAVNYYFDSGLYKIEFPLYVRFLQEYMANDVYYERLETVNSGNFPNIELYWLQAFDPFFQSALNRKWVPEHYPDYNSWKKKRAEYLALLENNNLLMHTFRSANPTPISFLISLIATNNIKQFIVCILFIFIVGMLLEAKIGSLLLIESYLLGGVLMISSYCLLAPYSLIPISGCNGGVAGLLGVLTVLYGTQKEKIYYYNGRGFASIYVPCFIFLPFWAVVEYALYFLKDINTINIISQIPALLGGGVIGYYLRKQNKFVLDLEEILPGINDLKDKLELAAAKIHHSHYEEAKEIYYELLKEYPSNKEIYMALIEVLKRDPASDEYHNLVKEILSLEDPTNSLTAMMQSVVSDYLSRAQPGSRLEPELLFRLVRRFAKYNYSREAVQLIKILLKNDLEKKDYNALPKEMFMIANHYFEKYCDSEGESLLNTLIQYFPESDEASHARIILERKNKPSS